MIKLSELQQLGITGMGSKAISAGFVIAGSGSGVGKTTISCGLMRLFADNGLKVAPFKIGPDFIDPSHHRVAARHMSRNLDAFMVGESGVATVYERGIRSRDIAVIEGVAGLYDGERVESDFASTAHVARLLEIPVILVVDAIQAGRSLAALVSGFASFDQRVNVAGVILNRVWKKSATAELAELLSQVGAPVVGEIPVNTQLNMTDRDLGLIPSDVDPSRSEEMVGYASQLVAEHVDWMAIAETARTSRTANTVSSSASVGSIQRSSTTVAVAAGPAFSFCYPENFEALESICESVRTFDPLRDSLPSADCVYLPGGYPEYYADDLANNQDLLVELRMAAKQGLPIYAECGGLLYLCQTIDDKPAAGIIDYVARRGQLELSYVDVVACQDSVISPKGYRTGAQIYHTYQAVPMSTSSHLPPLWTCQGIYYGGPDGVVGPTFAAGFAHTQWVTDLTIAEALCADDGQWPGPTS